MRDDTRLILRKLLDGYLSTKQKNTVEAGNAIHNEVGFNSSIICSQLRGDLNIDGNYLAISSFRTIEIEKDYVVRKSCFCNQGSSTRVEKTDHYLVIQIPIPIPVPLQTVMQIVPRLLPL